MRFPTFDPKAITSTRATFDPSKQKQNDDCNGHVKNMLHRFNSKALDWR
ncbi:hypothetical protein K788_0000046 [Paraburkholderia caribensis MBA4]|uniref:Uncharacterized protein n=1 Tax=Paraburkholderia caribensis MBA4 TaxID=1323664 RepID=A0A0P0RJQ6_9BURK|nr:hypothetical protein K788_0000046 [Paraburkholderia caribensis MBA4]